MLSLAAVSANFEHWRATRDKKSKIPEPLWQQVLTLLPKYSTSEISRVLGISGEQIKNKIAIPTPTDILTNHSANDFVAINIPIPEVGNTCHGSKVEIKRPDGAIICI